MIYLYIKLYYFYLYLSILLITVLSDNIDLEFPVVFTYKKSDSNSKLNQQSFGSYFGYSVSVNDDNGNN